MIYPLRRVWDPALYQGGGRHRGYFEGWYFKAVDADGLRPVAIIPGVSYSSDGRTAQAFVQLVRPGGASRFFAVSASEFTFDRRRFLIRVGPNEFSAGGVRLDLQDEIGYVRGELSFGPWRPWPVTAFSPGIMGWYRFVPRMECYHGVLSMDHAVDGSLEIGPERLVLDGGRGYTEKDWGSSFPSSWVWAQSNTFEVPGVSVTLSVARVPWLTGAFTGHIAGLLHDGELHRFATYTGARPVCLTTGPGSADVVLRDTRKELEVHVEGASPSALKAPTLGAMVGRADEALGATVTVALRALRGGRATRIFEGTGRAAGVEVMNDRGELAGPAC